MMGSILWTFHCCLQALLAMNPTEKIENRGWIPWTRNLVWPAEALQCFISVQGSSDGCLSILLKKQVYSMTPKQWTKNSWIVSANLVFKECLYFPAQSGSSLPFPRVWLWHRWAASHLLRSFARYLFRVLHPLAIVPATTPTLKVWFLWRCRFFAFTMGCLGGGLEGLMFFLFEFCFSMFFSCVIRDFWSTLLMYLLMIINEQ